eukprot:scaffold397067_cov17-Prasinocladus_malaysianus.AAC.1
MGAQLLKPCLPSTGLTPLAGGLQLPPSWADLLNLLPTKSVAAVDAAITSRQAAQAAAQEMICSEPVLGAQGDSMQPPPVPNPG